MLAAGVPTLQERLSARIHRPRSQQKAGLLSLSEMHVFHLFLEVLDAERQTGKKGFSGKLRSPEQKEGRYRTSPNLCYTVV
jgi:hypothetical protein